MALTPALKKPLKVAVIGASGHAKVVASAVDAAAEFELAGLIDPDIHGMAFGVRVLGRDEDLVRLVADGTIEAVVLGIGDNHRRRSVAERLASTGIAFASIIHPAATVDRSVVVGAGTVVLAGAVVNAGAVLGEHVIVNTQASVDHDCALADSSSVGPGATLGGGVHVGPGAIVALGASVLHGRTIGAGALVAAGAVVIGDVESLSVVLGVPARSVGSRKFDEPYL